MAYITLEDLRGELDIEGTGDNPLLQEAIEDAAAYIDGATNRHFEAVTETRYYRSDAISDENEFLLLVDDDLLTVTTLTNGDSDSTVIPAADYWLHPRNLGPPYFGIRLKTNSTHSWEFDTDDWVEVAGTWGYATTCPDDIRRATLVLAAYFFRQKDAQMFETTAILESGALAVPQGIPATVDRVIQRYRKYI